MRSFLKSFFSLLRPATEPLPRGVPPLDYRRRAFMVGTTLALAAAVLLGLPNAHADNSNSDEWVGTWATSPQIQMPGTTPTEFAANTTLRQIVHTSIGGSTVRVRLSNEIGTQPLVIGAAHVAVRSTGSGIVSGSDRTLTFGGQASVTIPPGAPALSDPVPLEVPALSDLAISVYLPNAAAGTTFHGAALQTNYIAPGGDFTSAAAVPNAVTTQSWFFLTAVNVGASQRADAIVTLGDSARP